MTNPHSHSQDSRIDLRDSAVDNADELIADYRDDMLKLALESRGESSREELLALAVAAELDSRRTAPVEPPAHMDPREELDGGYEQVADELIRETADKLGRYRDQVDDDRARELVIDLIAELDTRVGGGGATAAD